MYNHMVLMLKHIYACEMSGITTHQKQYDMQDIGLTRMDHTLPTAK